MANNDKRWIGWYRCNICLETFEAPAGPVVCRRCGLPYLKWLNFEKLRQDHPWHGGYPEQKR